MEVSGRTVLGVGVLQGAEDFATRSSFLIRANFLEVILLREALVSTRFPRTAFLLVTAVALLLKRPSNVSEKATEKLGGAAAEPAKKKREWRQR